MPGTDQAQTSCWIHKLEVEGAVFWLPSLAQMPVYPSSVLAGFKSYRESSILGPFAPFTCVIGPNGCGKSVLVCCLTTANNNCPEFEFIFIQDCSQGDAIAFVLGSTGHNLVNKALQACINDSLHSNTAAQPTRVRLENQYA